MQRDLLDVLNPGSSETLADTYDWTSFTLTTQPQGDDKKTNLLDYKQKGRWVALPEGTDGGWSVKWQSGKLPFSLCRIPFVYTADDAKEPVSY